MSPLEAEWPQHAPLCLLGAVAFQVLQKRAGGQGGIEMVAGALPWGPRALLGCLQSAAGEAGPVVQAESQGGSCSLVRKTCAG